jgi:diguanylate cyclase (GGDEF)-like protein
MNMSDLKRLEDELAHNEARLVDLAREQAELRARGEWLRRQLAQPREEPPSPVPAPGGRAPRDPAGIKENRANKRVRDSDRAAHPKGEAERAEEAKERGDAAVGGDRSEELADAQHALDRQQSELDDRQGELDRAQSAIHEVPTDPGNERELDRGQLARDREQADQDRAQAVQDRSQAAHDRGLDERRDYLIDDVTGMLRRGPGLRELKNEIDRARRQGVRLVVAFIDVDGLKAFNDRRGHAAGDQLLRDVGQALRQGLRSYDLVLRYGGDEFVCALSDAEIGHAERRLREVAELLRAAPSYGSISWGLAELQADDTLDSLVARSDSALYARRSRRDPPAAKSKRDASGNESGPPDRTNG